MQLFAKADQLETDKLPVGKAYSETLEKSNLATFTMPNTIADLAPPSYSDRTAAECYYLPLSKADNLLPFIDCNPVQEENKKDASVPPSIQNSKFEIQNSSSPLTFQDTLAVAYLEGKIYADNPELLQFLHNLENALIAKDVNNAAKNRPNISIKITGKDGKVQGYVLAYQGKLRNPDSESSIPKNLEGKDTIYIADMAAQPNTRAAGQLIRAFIQQYQTHYLKTVEDAEQGRSRNPLPLYFEARDTTSYSLIQRKLKKIGERHNLDFQVQELPTYQKGQNTMHPIFIQPIPKQHSENC